MNVAFTGKDVVVVNDRILNDLGDGDFAVLTYPEDLVTTTVGKNGTALHGYNEPGRMAELELRVLKGSPDDSFLNDLLVRFQETPTNFSLLTGNFTKRIGLGDGNFKEDNYSLSGGVFSKNVESKSNVSGDTDQAVSVYSLRFTRAERGIA